MSSEDKQQKLNLLRNFLDKQDVPKSYYSIGKFRDEAVCIEADGDGWIVYEGDRGSRYNEKYFVDFYEAGSYFLSKSTFNKSHREYLLSAFTKYWEQNEGQNDPFSQHEVSSLTKLKYKPDFSANANYSPPTNSLLSNVSVYILIMLVAFLTFRVVINSVHILPETNLPAHSQPTIEPDSSKYDPTNPYDIQTLIASLASKIDFINESDSEDVVIYKLTQANQELRKQIEILDTRLSAIKSENQSTDISVSEPVIEQTITPAPIPTDIPIPTPLPVHLQYNIYRLVDEYDALCETRDAYQNAIDEVLSKEPISS